MRSVLRAESIYRPSGLETNDENEDSDHAEGEDDITNDPHPAEVLKQILLKELGRTGIPQSILNRGYGLQESYRKE